MDTVRPPRRAGRGRSRRAPVALATAAASVAACLVGTACAARGRGGPGTLGGAVAGAVGTAVATPPDAWAAWAGRWEGIVGVADQVPIPITVTLGPAAGGGLAGTLAAAELGPAPVPFASVTAAGDSLTLRLPAALHGPVYRGRRSADGRRYQGVGDGVEVPVTFALAGTGTPEARALAAVPARIAASRAAAARLAASALAESASVRRPGDPDAARLVTSDIPRFWAAVDRAGSGAAGDRALGTAADSLAALLQRDYLEPGSPALHEFIPGRIVSAEDLAAAVRGQRARYASSRAGTLRVAEAELGIRTAFRRFKALYPDAVFPDVYFVVGRFTGGTSKPHGIIIGAETQRDPAGLPAVATHELVHAQQRYGERTLLEASFREGSANFLAELATGARIDTAAQRYVRAHEHALWQEYRRRLDSTDFAPWLYTTPPGDRPRDLGYVVGYRIAQAYYAKVADADVIVSWNFRHIVRFEKIRAFNAVNLKAGYKPLAIHSPREVATHGPDPE